MENPYTLYFDAEFDRPVTGHGFWKGRERRDGVDALSGADIAAYVSFGDGEPGDVGMRIGLSYVSVVNAAANLRAEVPDWDFDALRARTRAKWDGRLSAAEVWAPPEVRRVFFTALYHNLLQPSLFDDGNGEYIGFDRRIHRIPAGHHKYVGYSNWDIYRTSAQIRAMLWPAEASDMAASLLIDRSQSPTRSLPIWGYFNNDAGIMNGYSGIPFVVNTWAFGGRAMDMAATKAALVSDADTRYERGSSYLFHGYVPNFKSRWNYSVSMTLEYAIADFAVSRFCLAAGDEGNAKRFLLRAQNVFNLLDPMTGYLRPRGGDGSWVEPFSPTQEDGFNEGNSVQYSWSVPQNIAGLVRGMGGDKEVERRLDSFFRKYWSTGGIRPSRTSGPATSPPLARPMSTAGWGAPGRPRAWRSVSGPSIHPTPTASPGTTTSGRPRRSTCSTPSACTRRFPGWEDLSWSGRAWKRPSSIWAATAR